jgi:hypothetical protein
LKGRQRAIQAHSLVYCDPTAVGRGQGRRVREERRGEKVRRREGGKGEEERRRRKGRRERKRGTETKLLRG